MSLVEPPQCDKRVYPSSSFSHVCLLRPVLDQPSVLGDHPAMVRVGLESSLDLVLVAAVQIADFGRAMGPKGNHIQAVDMEKGPLEAGIEEARVGCSDFWDHGDRVAQEHGRADNQTS